MICLIICADMFLKPIALFRIRISWPPNTFLLILITSILLLRSRLQSNIIVHNLRPKHLITKSSIPKDSKRTRNKRKIKTKTNRRTKTKKKRRAIRKRKKSTRGMRSNKNRSRFSPKKSMRRDRPRKLSKMSKLIDPKHLWFSKEATTSQTLQKSKNKNKNKNENK